MARVLPIWVYNTGLRIPSCSVFFRRGRILTARGALLVACDVTCVLSALCAATVLRFQAGEPRWGEYVAAHMGDFLSIAFIFVLVFYAGGMYERETLTRKSRSWILPVVTVGVGLMLTSVLYYARLEIGVGRGIFAFAERILRWRQEHYLVHSARPPSLDESPGGLCRGRQPADHGSRGASRICTAQPGGGGCRRGRQPTGFASVRRTRRTPHG